MSQTDTRTPAALHRPAVSPAAAPIAAPRFDMYMQIHKGLRSLMAATLVEVGRMDWQDPAERDATLARLGKLLEVCRGHLEHENQFVHTAIERRMPGAAGQTEADHLEHVAAIDQLRRRIDALRQASGDAAGAAALALYRELAVFVAENFLHMQVEESRNNASLWSAYSDEELVEIHDALVASIPAEEMSYLLGLMLPAMAPAERVQMMLGMKAGMPAEAFSGVLEVVRQALSDRDWAKLSASVSASERALSH